MSRPTRSAACATSSSRTAITCASSCSRCPIATTSPPTASSTPRCRCSNYVATVQLKKVTDGDGHSGTGSRPSTCRKGREQEFDQLVGGGVYEAGFAGLRSYLNGGTARARAAAVESQGVVATGFGGPEVLQFRSIEIAPKGEVRIRQTAVGVNYIDVYIRKGLYKMITPPAPIGMEAAGVVVESERAGIQAGRSRRVCQRRRPARTSRCARCRRPSSSLLPDYVRRRDCGSGDAQGNDRGVPPASHASRAPGRRRCWCTPRRAASACCCASGRSSSARR